MSALGPIATETVEATPRWMSALPRKRTKKQRSQHVRFVPKADSCTAANPDSIILSRKRAGNASADLRCLRCGWQFIEQGLRLGQVRRSAPCVEEPIDVQQAVMRLRMPTLIGQDTGEARCRAQFERP